jgi:hypothetical protein
MATALLGAGQACGAEPPPPRAVIIQGYPAFDAPIIHFALRKQRLSVDMLEKIWLPPARWEDYSLVVITGDLARAKIEPNKFNADELREVQSYLERGGTLLLTRGTLAAFGTPEGRDFLAELTAAPPVSRGNDYRVLASDHPWLKHLDLALPHPWLASKNNVPISAGKGEILIGTEEGRALLYHLRVGKGQFIYIGWEIAASLPNGRKPSTVEDERIFEEQVEALKKLVGYLFPQ